VRPNIDKTRPAVVVGGLATRVQRPAGGPTRRSCTTPSAIPTAPKAWRSPRSGVTCCGWTVAGPAPATSTNSSNPTNALRNRSVSSPGGRRQLPREV